MPKWLTWGVVSLLALGFFASIDRTARPTTPASLSGRQSNSFASSNGRDRFKTDNGTIMMLPEGRSESIRSLLNIPGRMRYGDYVWDEAGVPLGALWIRIDLDTQLLSVFRAGNEIGSAVILYGDPNKPTPGGAFTIIEKAQDHYSRSYDAPMPYMLRLTRDGVAIHASAVRQGAATHGCIGVPMAFARKLFASAQLGDRVFVVGGTALPKP